MSSILVLSREVWTLKSRHQINSDDMGASVAPTNSDKVF